MDLLFFMLVIMQWEFGAVQAISVTVFVGFSVDFCAHLANSYNEATSNADTKKTNADHRYYKAQKALRQTGISVLMAAIATIASSLFPPASRHRGFCGVWHCDLCQHVFVYLLRLVLLRAFVDVASGPVGKVGSIYCWMDTKEVAKMKSRARG